MSRISNSGRTETVVEPLSRTATEQKEVLRKALLTRIMEERFIEKEENLRAGWETYSHSERNGARRRRGFRRQEVYYSLLGVKPEPSGRNQS